ncbi:polysaccharide biosynthesis C-terminal domain-containing protein [Facklamia sp. 7083-14-GEN3]|uniref:oligosaccharide flippase family protein n=1 Tax=Facklamia sp. 7083-14-GEN3 TaxID=2973478 RepID=UPI00215BEB79|nr:polysaccharide biosynthesis C-terminal domain-containing protein [Facklamia sp. 7083-14-GEN3]MCR8969221.1 oligosaccharide flippase family protein [Facklamia sp. 7083-14-GEN3]
MSDNQFDDKNQGFKNDYDRFDTLEFTKEDLKKLRHPNPRAMDSDYFDREIKADAHTNQLIEDRVDHRSTENEEESAITSQSTEEQVGELLVQFEDDSDEEIKVDEETTKEQFEASSLSSFEDDKKETEFSQLSQEADVIDDPVNYLKETLELEIDPDLFARHDFDKQDSHGNEAENPFQYRSIEESLREEHRNKRVANVRPGFFQRVFQTVFSTRDELDTLTSKEQEDEGNSQESLSTNTFEVEPFDSNEALTESSLDSDEAVNLEQEPLSESDLIASSYHYENNQDESQSEGEGLNQTIDSSLESSSNSFDEELIEVETTENIDEGLDDKDSQQQALYQERDQEINNNQSQEELNSTSVEPTFSEVNFSIETNESNSGEIELEAKKSSQTQMYNDEEIEALAWNILPEDHYREEQVAPKKGSNLLDKVKVNSRNAWAKIAANSAKLLEKTKQSTSHLLQTVQDHDDKNIEVEGDKETETEEQTPLDMSLQQESSDGNEQAATINNDDQESVNDEEKTKDKENLSEEESIAEGISQKTSSYEAPILTDALLEDTLDTTLFEAEKAQQELSEQGHSEDKSKFVVGAAWLSMGQILSRIIGALYIIPWATWLGAEYSQANSLYAVGYNPYVFFLSIAVAGFPAAVAKQIAFYSTKKEFKVVDKLFKYSLGIMAFSGILIASIFYFSAPVLVANSPTDNQEAAIIVVRSLAPALLILPTLSLFKGYFQGYSQMIPLALSEVLEQIMRVLYILGATYLIMMVYEGSITDAVAHSTFAAFVGALIALLFLVGAYIIHNRKMKSVKETSLNKMDINFMDSLKIMLRDSIPFILLGSGIIFAQNIDTYTFKQILVRTSVLLNSEIAELFGAMSLDVNKLVMIIVSFAVAIAASSIPAVSSKYAEGNINKTSELIKNIVLLFTFIMLPASIGMAIIADNVYPFFYPAGISAGPGLLATGSFTAIVLGAYTVFATILQSMDYRRFAITYLLVGLAIKLVLQFPMVALFQAHGALLATFFGFAVAAILMWMKIWRVIKIRDRYFVGDIVRIVIATTIMAIGTYGWNRLINLMMDPVGRGLTLVQIIIVVLIAILIYGGTMALFGMLPIIIGDYRADLQKKLSIHR